MNEPIRGEEPVAPTRSSSSMSDGVTIATALLLLPGKERFPTLLAASPYRFDNDAALAIALFLWRETGPTAYRFEKGSRVRPQLANGDSGVTAGVFAHPYTPDKVGRDIFHHDARCPSRLVLPVVNGTA